MAAEFEIQKAIYTVLNGDAALTALGPSIVDYGPADDDASTIYPFVAIGNIIVSEWDTDDTTGFDVLARIHTYSDSHSVKETKQIQGAIYDALHRQDISVTGYDDILIRREDSDVMRTSRGAFHGVCEYRGYLDKA